LRRPPQPERARTGVVLFSLGAAGIVSTGLLDLATSIIRWNRSSTVLTSTEVVLAALATFGLLFAPAIAWGRVVRMKIWPSTPRAVDLLASMKRVLVASLVTYAVGALLSRFIAVVLPAKHAAALVWPGWGVLLPTTALATGVFAAWVERIRIRR